jgi:hypothetical protein
MIKYFMYINEKNEGTKYKNIDKIEIHYPHLAL